MAIDRIDIGPPLVDLANFYGVTEAELLGVFGVTLEGIGQDLAGALSWAFSPLGSRCSRASTARCLPITSSAA